MSEYHVAILEHEMTDLNAMMAQLRNAGIQPIVTIAVEANALDVEAIKALHTNLKNAGFSPEVHINLSMPSTPDSQPSHPHSQPGTGSEIMAVRVKEARLNCFSFRKLDNAGKPQMTIVEPRVQLPHGAEFSVSSTHKLSNIDPGNGTVFGTGNIEFFLVVDCPPNPAAVGLYIRKVDIERLP